MDAKTMQLAVGLSDAMTSRWASPILAAMAEFGIDTPKRQAAFLPQAAHESKRFASLHESFDYSIPSLRSTFRDRINGELANRLGRQPGESSVPMARQATIANLVYGGRFGNNTTGDGWRYRGGGIMQITFLANYAACRDAIGVDIVGNIGLVDDPVVAARMAGWFWKTRRCNDPADAGDFVGLTKKINPALNGLDDRTALWLVAKRVLGVQ